MWVCEQEEVWWVRRWHGNKWELKAEEDGFLDRLSRELAGLGPFLGAENLPVIQKRLVKPEQGDLWRGLQKPDTSRLRLPHGYFRRNSVFPPKRKIIKMSWRTGKDFRALWRISHLANTTDLWPSPQIEKISRNRVWKEPRALLKEAGVVQIIRAI